MDNGWLCMKDEEEESMIIKLNNIVSSPDFYMFFNRRVYLNIGTNEGGNQVVIIRPLYCTWLMTMMLARDT